MSKTRKNYKSQTTQTRIAMNKKEFESQLNVIREAKRELEKREIELKEAYGLEVLQRNGFKPGDIVTSKDGRRGVIIRVGFSIGPRAVVNPIKKDGTPSVMSSWSMGFYLKEE